MAAVGCEKIHASDMNDTQIISDILDILEKHYHGRNWLDRRCAEELLTLIEKERHGL